MPLMSAAVLTVGAGIVASVGLECSVRDTCEAVDDFTRLPDLALYAWMSALAVVFLAVMMPRDPVPGWAGLSMGRAVKIAEQTVQSGVQTGIMVSGMAASGALGGVCQGKITGIWPPA